MSNQFQQNGSNFSTDRYSITLGEGNLEDLDLDDLDLDDPIVEEYDNDDSDTFQIKSLPKEKSEKKFTSVDKTEIESLPKDKVEKESKSVDEAEKEALLKEKLEKEPRSTDKAEESSSVETARVSDGRATEGIASLNKNLDRILQKYASSELNGLSLLANLSKPLTATIGTVLESSKQKEKPLDKQAEGVAIVKRLSEIMSDRFIGNSSKPFTWLDPNTKKKYQFEVIRGLTTEAGKTKVNPKVVKAIDMSNNEEVFKANSLDGRKWQIEKCEFSKSQLISLQSAHVVKEKKSHDLSKSKKSDKSKAKKQVELEI